MELWVSGEGGRLSHWVKRCSNGKNVLLLISCRRHVVRVCLCGQIASVPCILLWNGRTSCWCVVKKI